MDYRRTYGVEVIVDSDLSKHPICYHGPTLLFERFSQDNNNGRKFYACSATRDRKDCDFFSYADDKMASKKNNSKVVHMPFSRAEYMKRLETIKRMKEKERKFCQRCSMLLIPDEWSKHTSHGFLEELTLKKLVRPSSLLRPKEANKSNAQYFFSERTIQFVVKTLQTLKIKKVICIGTPTIHECVIDGQCGISSILLDIDSRFAQFYDESLYCHYNLFNHYFFEKSSENIFTEFLLSDKSIAIIVDPPFGGLVDVICHTLKTIILARESHFKDSTELPILWFFPYFNEARITKNFPSLKMMDYKVDYDNHSSFHSNGRKQGSPVRIFTNLDASKFHLPHEEGYKFCEKCQRFVSRENEHCEKCNSCTSKDGRPYTHCDLCKICVKSSKSHCSTCKHCVLPNHKCGEISISTRCHRCGKDGHKRTECPKKTKINSPKKKRKRIKQ